MTTDTKSARDANPILLSICIPSYNRGPFLAELLQSITDEITALPDSLSDACLEVVISDNASTDDTPNVVAAYGRKLRIRYVRQSENIGADRNYIAVVEAANGRFCWLMGSDDIVEAGGLEHVLRAALDCDVAGFSVNYHKRSFDLQKTSTVRPPVRYKSSVAIEGREEIYRNFVGHWGYLSAQIVRRDLWQAVCASGEPSYFLNGYVHVLVMGRMIERMPRWSYIHAICVGWRGRNDSFVSGDHVDRLMIDIRGYGDITRRLFGTDSATTNGVMNSIAATHILVHYRVAKIFYHSGASLRLAARVLIREYWRYPAFWTRLLPWIVIPAPILHGLWIGYQRGRSQIDSQFNIHPQARKKR
jgi:abequosyltransferase